MQLVVDIPNESVAKKVLAILNIFKEDGVKIETIDRKNANPNDTQEYDTDYERSFQYKLDRAEFEEMKKKQ